MKDSVEELVTISKREYDNLKKRDRELSALEQAGVDNWSGYGDHWEYMEDDE